MMKEIVHVLDEDCERCNGTGCEPMENYEPTYEELVSPSPRPCWDCDGRGKKIEIEYDL